MSGAFRRTSLLCERLRQETLPHCDGKFTVTSVRTAIETPSITYGRYRRPYTARELAEFAGWGKVDPGLARQIEAGLCSWRAVRLPATPMRAGLLVRVRRRGRRRL